jgi:hypothetical protein
MWQTEGKGEEDLAVHAFQRRVATDAPDGDLRRCCSNRNRVAQQPAQLWRHDFEDPLASTNSRLFRQGAKK